jgi:methylthioribose-1-phosphate isomerase
MQHGQVDLVITGTDRTSANGDVANKIGTYLKALAAHDNAIPFYVALPSSTIDWALTDGLAGTPIESRHADEVLRMEGIGPDGALTEVRIAPEGTAAANHAFDVTPARLVTALLTERGACPATTDGIAALFPEEAGR